MVRGRRNLAGVLCEDWTNLHDSRFDAFFLEIGQHVDKPLAN
jgi:hypothetical protein